MRTPRATESPAGLPEAPALYGPLPEQLEDPDSFASRIRVLMQARERFGISAAELVAVPDLEDDAVFALVMRLPDDVGGVAVTLANYGQEETTVMVDLSSALNGTGVLDGNFPVDIIAEEAVGTISGSSVEVSLDGLSGRTLVIGAQERDLEGGS